MAFYAPPGSSTGEGDPIEERKRALLERLRAGGGQRRNVAGGVRASRGARGRGAPVGALMSAAGRFNRPFGMGGVFPGIGGVQGLEQAMGSSPVGLPPMFNFVQPGASAPPVDPFMGQQGWNPAFPGSDIMEFTPGPNVPIRLGRYQAF